MKLIKYKRTYYVAQAGCFGLMICHSIWFYFTYWLVSCSNNVINYLTTNKVLAGSAVADLSMITWFFISLYLVMTLLFRLEIILKCIYGFYDIHKQLYKYEFLPYDKNDSMSVELEKLRKTLDK